MPRDEERIRRIRDGMQAANLDAIVCAAPMDVLLLSGYWPVIGISLALATKEGEIILLVPEDERERANTGWADRIETFQAGSLTALRSTLECLAEGLAAVRRAVNLSGRRIGVEMEPLSEPGSYAAMTRFGSSLAYLLAVIWPSASLLPADSWLSRQRSVKTPQEVERIRRACRIAEEAFVAGKPSLRPGLKETGAANLFRDPLSSTGVGFEGVERADGFTYCMSGPNAAQAYAAFQMSRDRRLELGELALVHGNSYADGYWTDITRTYCVGEPNARQSQWMEAIFTAREAALAAIYPGKPASAVDQAAREALKANGLGHEFKHPTGHGVGFGAIDHNAPPRLHPLSSDVLQTGMVFNIEPGVYFAGEAGCRHCDMVVVTETGAEVLTPFQTNPKEWMLPVS